MLALVVPQHRVRQPPQRVGARRALVPHQGPGRYRSPRHGMPFTRNSTSKGSRCGKYEMMWRALRARPYRRRARAPAAAHQLPQSRHGWHSNFDVVDFSSEYFFCDPITWAAATYVPIMGSDAPEARMKRSYRRGPLCLSATAHERVMRATPTDPSLRSGDNLGPVGHFVENLELSTLPRKMRSSLHLQPRAHA